MNVNSKIKKRFRDKIPRNRNSVKYNTLNLKLPRKLIFSGNFRLNTVNFLTDSRLFSCVTN